jgi:tRNA A37 threonylcarbamoyladenosine synthetase subunit TsaC/SUA5/YrdC
MDIQIHNTSGNNVSLKDAISILNEAKEFFERVDRHTEVSQIDQILEAFSNHDSEIEITKTTTPGALTTILTISCITPNRAELGLTMYKQNLGQCTTFSIPLFTPEN